MVQVINYGMGNIGSILNMLKKIGEGCILIDNPNELRDGYNTILPGVGAFDNAMHRLNESGFSNKLRIMCQANTPLLGICLGMQLLGNGSEEGSMEGLKLIPGISKRFKSSENLKIPHMGWNHVNVSDDGLYARLEENKFYFVHSFHFVPDQVSSVLGVTSYGEDFVSSIKKENVFGAQFHPEKSHKYGMKLLKNFCAIK